MIDNRAKGTHGEVLAVNYLKQKGFEIIARNYSPKSNFQGGEIDIIALKPPSPAAPPPLQKGELSGVIHFIEVKSRTSDKFGLGREAVTPAKQKIIRKLATLYLVQRGIYDTASCCFDVIEINGTQIEHFTNCF